MEFKKDLDLVGKIAAHSVMSGKYKDKDGNIKEILPVGPGNSLDFDQFREDIGAFGGGSGGSTDPNHPTAGADYYAGSLADGEITERYLLYQRDESVAEQTGSQTVTLLRDVGTKFNMDGDGATFLIHLQKTAMTKGAKGDVTDIELNYDPTNVAKDGYFTTTSPYPIYIKASDLATKKTLAIPINGIGESLSGKNVKAPQLNVTFNGNGTMTFESVTGYDNDGYSTGATGANYEVIVDVIATFSVQSAVAQIPASVNLFSGSATHEIALAGSSDFLENLMDGIEIHLGPYFIGTWTNASGIQTVKVSRSTFDIPSQIKIDKSLFIIGYKLKINRKPFTGQADYISTNQGTYESNVSDCGGYFVTIGKNSIDLETDLYVGYDGNGNKIYAGSLANGINIPDSSKMSLPCTQINTYKD
ncbi:hypothetical protein [Companilactobacillus musae]|uniref:hypothetical protein n=1 Tax=Companilactobacillus musae TaxID=1903258 RepID=UPI003446003F